MTINKSSLLIMNHLFETVITINQYNHKAVIVVTCYNNNDHYTIKLSNRCNIGH